MAAEASLTAPLGGSICRKNQPTAVCPIKSRSQEIFTLTRKNYSCIKTFTLDGKCLDSLGKHPGQEVTPTLKIVNGSKGFLKPLCLLHETKQDQDKGTKTVISTLPGDSPKCGQTPSIFVIFC